MKINKITSFFLITFSFIIFSVFTQPATAKADVLDDIGWVLGEMGSANPLAQYGVTKETITGSKELIICIADGKKSVTTCLSDSLNSPIGKQMSGDLPSWFWDLINLYIDFSEQKYWNIIQHLGQSAICIVSQVVTGGVDVCGLITELVHLAGEVYDLANDVIKYVNDFFDSVFGIDILDTIGDVACTGSLGLVGCDDPPPPPPRSEIAYGAYFAPHIANGEGLKRIELKGTVQYYKLISDAADKAYAAKFSGPDIAIAKNRFEVELNKQWSGDILNMKQGPLVNQTKDRTSYINNTSNAIQMFNKAWVDSMKEVSSLGGSYGPSTISPQVKISNECYKNFTSALPYEHIDRWILKNQENATKSHVTSNTAWCSELFLNKYKQEFASRFIQNMAGICQQSGNKLICSTPEKFQQCYFMTKLKPFGVERSCVATPNATLTAAQAIQNDFKAEAGTSKPPVNPFQVTPVIKPSAAAGSPALLVNARPRYFDFCEKAVGRRYHSEIKNYLVKCTQQYDPKYFALINQIKLFVDSQNKIYGAGLLKQQMEIDPLYVTLNFMPTNQYPDYLLADKGFKPPSETKGFTALRIMGTSIPYTTFGTSTPSILYSSQNFGSAGKATDPYKNKLQHVNTNNSNPAYKQGIATDTKINTQMLNEATKASTKEQKAPAKQFTGAQK